MRQPLLDYLALNMKPVKTPGAVDPTSRRNVTYFDFTITTVGSARLKDFKQK